MFIFYMRFYYDKVTGEILTSRWASGEIVVSTPARQELTTKFRYMDDNVTVLEIPYHKVSNADGTTVIIGGMTNNDL